MASPLADVSVVVTRAAHQAAPLIEALQARGARVVRLPLIEVLDPADGGDALRNAVAHLKDYEWAIFTSANTVARVIGLADFGSLRIAVIGSATASALAEASVNVDLLPEKAVGEALVAAFPHGGGRVFLPQAAGARPIIAEGLRAKGWSVDAIEAYRTADVDIDEALATEVVSADIITFLSSSAVDSFVERVGIDQVPSLVATIGPITSATARAHRLQVDIEAEEHSVSGLVTAIEEHLARLRS